MVGHGWCMHVDIVVCIEIRARLLQSRWRREVWWKLGNERNRMAKEVISIILSLLNLSSISHGYLLNVDYIIWPVIFISLCHLYTFVSFLIVSFVSASMPPPSFTGMRLQGLLWRCRGSLVSTTSTAWRVKSKSMGWKMDGVYSQTCLNDHLRIEPTWPLWPHLLGPAVTPHWYTYIRFSV